MYEKKILLGFIRVHILYHASLKNGMYGIELIEELKRHGYSISPGTIYPILHEMEDNNLLKKEEKLAFGKIRKIYRITNKGKKTLENLKGFIIELSEEVI